jgi:hypothetical protein
MDTTTPVKYISANFLPDDRLAVVLLQKTTGDMKQRITSAARVASEPFQAWLRHMNSEHYEIYVSVNTLHKHAQGRTKADVAEIRHICLDFDEHGNEGIERLRNRKDLPPPNHLLQTSPGKWQAIWKVQGFAIGQDERLMQGLVHELGADKAVHDSARVLRLPGFYNHKYEKPHLVTVQSLSHEFYEPRQFPQYKGERLSGDLCEPRGSSSSKHLRAGHLSQSERDWAYAKRSLARGEAPRAVIDAIATFRSDKPDPQYYAELTVKKALQTLTHDPNRQSISVDRDGTHARAHRYSAR